MRIALLSLIILAVAVLSASRAAELPAPSGEGIVDPDARLQLLFTRTADIEGGLTEGPAVAPDGSIFFSDIPMGKDNGMILRFDPNSGATTVFADNSHKSNGLIFDASGNLIACEGANFGGRCVARWNIKTGERTVIVDRYQGKRFNSPNDLCLDAMGRIYFTDPRYVGDEARELPVRAVYRIDPDGKISMATDQVSKPNGIAISPDGKTLYLADHDNGTDKIDPSGPEPTPGDMKIYAFAIAADGSLGNRRTIVDFGDKRGCDGMCVDEGGNVYLTARDPSRPGVLVVDPAGKEVGFIPTGAAGQPSATPVGLPSNVEFGIGDESNILYVTVDTSLFRITLKKKGYHVQYRNH